MSEKEKIPTYDEAFEALKNTDSDILEKALFGFHIDDTYYIEQVEKAIRSVLIRSDLKPKQIIGIGRALHGIGRLPLRTPGLDIQISLSIKGDSGAEEYEFYLDDSRFLTSSGGYMDFGYGSDSFSGPTFEVEPNCRELSNWSFGSLEWPEAFSEMSGAELKVVDLSDDRLLDWEHPNGSIFWEWIAGHA
jgi:hypothetical protein